MLASGRARTDGNRPSRSGCLDLGAFGTDLCDVLLLVMLCLGRGNHYEVLPFLLVVFLARLRPITMMPLTIVIHVLLCVALMRQNLLIVPRCRVRSSPFRRPTTRSQVEKCSVSAINCMHHISILKNIFTPFVAAHPNNINSSLSYLCDVFILLLFLFLLVGEHVVVAFEDLAFDELAIRNFLLRKLLLISGRLVILLVVVVCN